MMMLPPIDVACCNRWCMLHFSHVQRAFQQLPPPHNEMEPFPFRFLSFRCHPLRSSDIKRLRSLPHFIQTYIYILLITNIGDWVARQQKCNGVRKFLPLYGCTSIDRLACYPILYAPSTRNWDLALHYFFPYCCCWFVLLCNRKWISPDYPAISSIPLHTFSHSVMRLRNLASFFCFVSAPHFLRFF